VKGRTAVGETPRPAGIHDRCSPWRGHRRRRSHTGPPPPPPHSVHRLGVAHRRRVRRGRRTPWSRMGALPCRSSWRLMGWTLSLAGRD